MNIFLKKNLCCSFSLEIVRCFHVCLSSVYLLWSLCLSLVRDIVVPRQLFWLDSSSSLAFVRASTKNYGKNVANASNAIFRCLQSFFHASEYELLVIVGILAIFNCVTDVIVTLRALQQRVCTWSCLNHGSH